MISSMRYNQIIQLKQAGKSFTEIGYSLGINRQTVSKYWNKYQELSKELGVTTDKQRIAEIQEEMLAGPKYETGRRNPTKRTKQFYDDLDKILKDEEIKRQNLKTHKQSLTKYQIYEKIRKMGHDVCYSTVFYALQELEYSNKECFIRQQHNLGERLEYDFGEVKLIINGKSERYYIAVISSPAAGFRWCYLYKNSKKDVFLDSHVRFFAMIGGVWQEVVYDNMRNVVKKFLGKNEKILNDDLVRLSCYYGFKINTTNAFSGNEKGYVEGSVKFLRNQIFADNYRFDSIEDVIAFMNSKLVELNRNSAIEDEKKFLIPAKPPLDLAEIRECRVDKTSFVKIMHNSYSVPEYLVGRLVIAKIYLDRISIYANHELVCTHNRILEKGKTSADIRHFLNTLAKKPGAIRDSVVLKLNPDLKLLYDKYYTSIPKKFIAIIMEYKTESDAEIIFALKQYIRQNNPERIDDKAITRLNDMARHQMVLYTKL